MPRLGPQRLYILVLRLFLIVIMLLVSFPQFANAQSPNENSGTMQNPVIQTNFPDPFVLPVEDGYYAYSTTSNSRNVPLAFSTDLVNWDVRGDAMPALAKWININRPDVWAPEVIQVGNQYLLFYTARDKISRRQCIGLAISDAPKGPFRDRSDTPFICQVDEGGSIDPNPFRDEDGTLYLFWKNDGNCCSKPTYLYGQKLSPDGLSLIGEEVRLIRNEHTWEGTVVEAPTMWRHDGRYYLFYSGNMYATERYAVGYATCDSPLGPCHHADENPILSSIMDTQPLVMGPGHQTLIVDKAGQTWIVYHVWQISSRGTRTDIRQMWLDRLNWVDGRPVVQGPTREPQPAPVTSTD